MRPNASFVALAAMAAGPLVLAGSAVADPANRWTVPVELTCDDGRSYEAVFVGGAAWNVYLVRGSNAVIVPTGYSFNGVLTDSSGVVVGEVHEPYDEKGNSAGHQPNEHRCSFEYSVDRDDGSRARFWGEGTFFITPGR